MNLCAIGMVCSVGMNASAACAAIRAGIAGFGELPYWDRENLSIVGAAVPKLSFELRFGRRLLEMLQLAVRDCLSCMPESSLENVPLFLGLAEAGRPGGAGGLGEKLIEKLEDGLGLKFHPELSRAVAEGHTAGFECLRVARELLKDRDIPGCLVCGVDSYINASSLFWLDQSWRLKRDGHTDGVIPGEAAAAVYVQRRVPSQAKTLLEVVGLGFGHERAPVLAGEPLLARGLADAARQALGEAGWGFHELDFRLSDVTGENYGFREHTLAEGRLVRMARVENQPLWHCADSIGDTGAAAGVAQLVIAAAAMAKGYAPGPRAACFTSSVMGGRAVAAVQVPTV